MGRKKLTKAEIKRGKNWSSDARPAKKAMKKFLKNAGINIPQRKKAQRALRNPNANWL